MREQSRCGGHYRLIGGEIEACAGSLRANPCPARRVLSKGAVLMPEVGLSGPRCTRGVGLALQGRRGGEEGETLRPSWGREWILGTAWPCCYSAACFRTGGPWMFRAGLESAQGACPRAVVLSLGYM